ncbi:MAG: carbohydrate porin [Thiomonas sp.]|uniref:Putative carbohydrate-selective porin OprB n=1 Tax=mine drainage metagenome TaxID=410659 RepID=E6PQS0_9ZZZZ
MRKFHVDALYALLLAIALLTAWLRIAHADDTALSTSGRLDLTRMANLSGGLQSRPASSALFQWGGSLATGPALGWPGGLIEFSIEGVRSDGNLPARTGAIQMPSNAWAPNFLRVYQLTYRQQLGAAAVRVGIMDITQYFEVSDLSSLLQNSSFGLMPTLTANLNAPTFPNPGLGAMAEYRFNPDSLARAGVWQGNPPALAGALHQGALWIGEVERDWTAPNQSSPQSDLKLGVWHDSESDPMIGPTTSGGYLVGETRWATGTQQWGAFILAGTSPGQVNLVTQFVAAGFIVTGPFVSRPQDQFSLGVSRVNLHAPAPETVLEAVYSWQLTPALALQPDVQRFWHPGGTNPSAVVAGLRVHLAF